MTAESQPARPHQAEESLRIAAARCYEYLRGINSRSVAPLPHALEELQHFQEDFPELPADPSEVVTFLDRWGSPATVATTGPRYFGFVNGATLPAALAASWLANTWDQNAALRIMSPVAAELEEIVLRWVGQALGLPGDCAGSLVTCATTANFTGLATARQALLARLGWNAAEQGLFGAPPLQVIVGEEVHASILKALQLVGFGSKRVLVVEADEQGRMRADRLPRIDQNTIVCIQAGNVNTGAFDPAREICERAHAQNAWVHVDGAFGLWTAVSPKYRHLVDGFDLADSWSLDGHKWPNINYDSGILLTRDAHALRSTMAVSAPYLQTGNRREPNHHTPEASRRARGVELWAGLKSLGRKGLANLIETSCSHAQRFATGLREAGFDILNDVVINQVLVSFGSPEINLEIIRRIQQDGTCWCGGTLWKGRSAMRISVSSWATTEADVDLSRSAMIRIAREVSA
jgi:glutamate/tyrosine decarboxylase-like PLP-dependent enzyme